MVNSLLIRYELKAWPVVKAQAAPGSESWWWSQVEINAKIWIYTPNNREWLVTLFMHYELKAWPVVKARAAPGSEFWYGP